MKARRDEVAILAGVPLDQVHPATADEIRRACADRVPTDVLEIATYGTGETGEAHYFWRVGDTCYLDDATFGDVVAIDDLRYDSTLGLYDTRWNT